MKIEFCIYIMLLTELANHKTCFYFDLKHSCHGDSHLHVQYSVLFAAWLFDILCIFQIFVLCTLRHTHKHPHTHVGLSVYLVMCIILCNHLSAYLCDHLIFHDLQSYILTWWCLIKGINVFIYIWQGQRPVQFIVFV